MKRLLSVAAMVALLLGTSLVATTSSAMAAPPRPLDLRHCYDQPDQTLFCFWSQSLYNGTMGLIDPVRSGHCVDLTANGGITGWSYYNHSGQSQRVWSNGNCTAATG